MHAFTNRHNIHDLHFAQVRFGGDIFLQPRSERLAELVSRNRKHQCKWDQHQPPQRGPCPSQREPGEGGGEKRGGRKVGAAARVNRQSAFTGIESGIRLRRRGPNILRIEIAEQKKTGGIGMPRHALAGVLPRKQVNGGVFERVVAPRFENVRKVEDHIVIIK